MNFLKEAYSTKGLKVQLIIGLLIAAISVGGLFGLYYLASASLTNEIIKQVLGVVLGLGLSVALLPMFQEFLYNKFG